MTSGRLALVSTLLLSLSAASPALAGGEGAAPPPAAPAVEATPAPFQSPLLTPEPLPMAPPCHFCSSTLTTSPGGGAASHWGHGATCTEAKNDVTSQLSSFVNADCTNYGTAGRCAFAVVYTSDCYAQNSVVVVDAYATYRCWVYYC
jgi:hypothetical protein